MVLRKEREIRNRPVITNGTVFLAATVARVAPAGAIVRDARERRAQRVILFIASQGSKVRKTGREASRVSAAAIW
jgi:hypothetical protein